MFYRKYILALLFTGFCCAELLAADKSKSAAQKSSAPPSAEETTEAMEEPMKLSGEKSELVPIANESKKIEVVKLDKVKERIVVSEDPKHPWVKRDLICVFHDAKATACGRVIVTTNQMALVQVDSGFNAIRVGDEARFIEAKKSAELGIPPGWISREPKPGRMSFGAGVLLSTDLMIPTAHFYWMISPSVAVGVQPGYFARTGNAGSKLGGYGGSLTVDYFAEEYFHGFWTHLSSGFYSVNLTGAETESFSAPMVNFLIGWRDDWAGAFNIGLGIGGRYFAPLKATAADVKYQQFYFTSLLELGFSY